MSVASSVIAERAYSITLIHHSPLELSVKYQEAGKRILKDILNSTIQTDLIHFIKANISHEDLNTSQWLEKLKLPEVMARINFSSDLNEVQNASIILCGASAGHGFFVL
jgi:hypothetical protein